MVSGGLSLVWSLDGKTIGTLSPETHTVHIYDVASGTTLFSSILQMSSSTTLFTGIFHSRSKPYLWVCGETFQVMTTAEIEDDMGWEMNILEVGDTLTKLESFPFHPIFHLGAFSPAPYHVSVSINKDKDHGPELGILDIHNSEVLLEEADFYQYHTFSPGGEPAFTFGDTPLAVTLYRRNSNRLKCHFNFHPLYHQSWVLPMHSSMYCTYMVPLIPIPGTLPRSPIANCWMPFLPMVPILLLHTTSKVLSQSPISVLKTLPLSSSLTLT